MRSGTHGSSVGIVRWTGVPSPCCWPRSLAAPPSNTAARKIGDALGVEVEHLGCIGREPEAVVRGPLADGVAAARAGS